MTVISLLISALTSAFSRAKLRTITDLPPLLNLTIESAAEGLQSGLFTSVDLVTAYLARIEEASEFNAVLEVNQQAIDAAHRLDEERKASGSRGPLHEIPILVKDNIATQDNLQCSAGSYALLGAKPTVESSVISKLRQAGAIILGKTNMSEWANFRGQNISAGWSPRGGQTLGTYYAHSRSDGSSAGSAVATALELSVAALGTETWGSIVDPAEIQNVVGLKPSRGLIGTDGAVPISKGQDVIGPLTRTVKDAAYMLNSWPSTDLTGITIGILRSCFNKDPKSALMTSFESAMGILRSAGAKVVDNANFPAVDEFLKLSSEERGYVRTADFKRDIAAYLQSLETNPNNLYSLDEIINFTKSSHLEGYPEQDIGNFLLSQSAVFDVDSEDYTRHAEKEQYFGGDGGILGAMKQHGLDVFVVPSTIGVATDLASKMGFPLISVPLGFWPEGTPVQIEDKKEGHVSGGPGIPYCLAFGTKAFSEDELLQVAYAFEQLSKVCTKGPLPYHAPKTELKDVQKTGQKI
ncbi:amidase signature enzyme [Cadophora sp. DSE1049]|nr:amidase signature enzyme [Cadophora sp. DSE1049]